MAAFDDAQNTLADRACPFGQTPQPTVGLLPYLMSGIQLPPYLMGPGTCGPLGGESAQETARVQSHWIEHGTSSRGDGDSADDAPMCRADGASTNPAPQASQPGIIGTKPRADGKDHSTYFYHTPPGSPVQEIGGGLFSNYKPDGTGTQALTMNGKFGIGRDSDGNFFAGADGGLTLSKTRVSLSKHFFLNLEGPSLQGSQSIRSDGATIGPSLNIVSGGIEYNNSDPRKNNDRMVSVSPGLSFPPLSPLRAHWSDNDHDGRREYGLGLNLGPVSVDYKTEQPVGDLLSIVNPGLGAIYKGAKDYLGRKKSK